MSGNKDNTIYNDKGEILGYYADLVECLKYSLELYLKENDFENASSVCEDLAELAEFKDYSELIVLSENNGMGFTARKYIDTISQEK